MAQPPSLDHAQKLSQVDFLRVSLLWRPLREARVSNTVGRGRRRGSGRRPEPPSGCPRGNVEPGWGHGRLSRIGGWPVCRTLAQAGQRRSRTPPAAGSPEGRPAPGCRRESRARRRPRADWRVAVSVPGAYFHLFGLQAPGVGRAFPPRAALGAEPGRSLAARRARRRGGGGGPRSGRPQRAGGALLRRRTRHGPSSLSITRTC